MTLNNFNTGSGGYPGLVINAAGAQTHNQATGSRQIDTGVLGQTHGGQRQLYEALGYDEEIEFAQYWARYQRDGIARRIIDKPVEDTWQAPPDIVDDIEQTPGSDPSGARAAQEPTAFEEGIASLYAGEHQRKSLHQRLRAVDKLATIGEFGILLFGFADGGDLSGEVNEGAFSSPEDLAYISVFDQGRVEEVHLVEDPADERYGLPETYEVAISEDRDAEIHHSRVIHVAENTLDDDLFGVPALKPAWNRLDDLDKLLGGSAEMFWRGAYPGIIVKPPSDERGVPYLFDEGLDDDGEGISEQIAEWEHNLRRTIFGVGDMETLDTAVENPAPHINEQVRAISASTGIPKNMLTGNETGERATKEDRKTWHEWVRARRQNFAEPSILRPLIDHLIYVGILPAPEGPSFSVEWPSLDAPSRMEEAETASKWATAIAQATGSQPQAIASPEELRSKIMGWSPEIGSEVAGDFSDPADEERSTTPGDPGEEPDAPAEGEEGPTEELDDSPPAPGVDSAPGGGDPARADGSGQGDNR